MKRQRRARAESIAALVAALAATLAAGALWAQELPASLEPGFGWRHGEYYLDSEVDGRLFRDVGGERCEGYVSTRPVASFELAEPVEMTLRMRETVRGSLIVHGPSGVFCTGPPELGPSIERTWPAGRYSVYVGTVGMQWGVAVTLDTYEPGSEPGGAPIGLARPDDAALVTGPDAVLLGDLLSGDSGLFEESGSNRGSGPLFVADYYVDGEWVAGTVELTGTLSADLPVADIMAHWGLEPCEGMVGVHPRHTLQLFDASTARGLVLRAETPPNLVLIVDGPDVFGVGGLRCVTPDDEGLMEDVLEEPGTYRIWVGSQSGAPGEYRLGVFTADD